EVVKLKPGEQTLTFTARVGKGEPVTRSVKLTYHPRLPRLDRDALPSPRLRVGAPLDHDLRVRLTALAHPYPFTASVRVNDGEAIDAKLSDENLVLTAAVKLRPGANRVTFTFDNGFRKEDGEQFELYVPRPPEIVSLDEPKVGEEPRIAL